MFSDVQVDNLRFNEIVRYKDYLSVEQMLLLAQQWKDNSTVAR